MMENFFVKILPLKLLDKFPGVEDDEKDQQQQFSNINKQYLYLMSSSGDKAQDKSVRHRPKPSTASTHPKDGTQLSVVEERSVNSPSLSEHTARSSLSTTPGIVAYCSFS